MLPLQFTEHMDDQVYRGCTNENCDCVGEPLYFKPLCHARAGLTMVYFEGIATIACIVCGKAVTRLAVAAMAHYEEDTDAE